MKIVFDRSVYEERASFADCWYFKVDGSAHIWRNTPDRNTDPTVEDVMKWLEGVVKW
jgi:hypothetical protein